MSDLMLNKAVAKLARDNPEFKQALQAQLKQAAQFVYVDFPQDRILVVSPLPKLATLSQISKVAKGVVKSATMVERKFWGADLNTHMGGQGPVLSAARSGVLVMMQSLYLKRTPSNGGGNPSLKEFDTAVDYAGISKNHWKG